MQAQLGFTPKQASNYLINLQLTLKSSKVSDERTPPGQSAETTPFNSQLSKTPSNHGRGSITKIRKTSMNQFKIEYEQCRVPQEMNLKLNSRATRYRVSVKSDVFQRAVDSNHPNGKKTEEQFKQQVAKLQSIIGSILVPTKHANRGN